MSSECHKKMPDICYNIPMKGLYITRLVMVAAAALCLNGCATLTIFSYLEKGANQHYGGKGTPSLYRSNDVCSVYGTCSAPSTGTSVWGNNVGTSSVWGKDDCGVWGC